MNILLLAPHPFYEERGTPIADKWVAEALAGAGHRVDMLVFPFGREVDIPGVRVLRCARPWGVQRVGIGFSPQKLLCDVTLISAARRLLRENSYHVIHACEESVFPALWLARRARLPVVYDMDSSMADQLMEKWGWLKLFRWLLEGFEAQAVRRSDLILPVCRSLADKVQAFSPGKTMAILHDQAMHFPPVPPGTENLRATLGLTGPLVLYVGNLEHYQGVDLLVDGFAAVAEQVKDAALVIVGGAEKDVAKARARASGLGLEKRIHLLGPRPLNRLQYYLEQADVLVSPRLRGVNTPMKIYSYLLAGRAVVATRIESHTQVMDETICALVEPEAAALGRVLGELMRDPERRARLGEAAARRARERHSVEAYRATLLGAYARLGISA
jgi:glycosyltransferase involved in cell wall biosynthesis